MTMLAARSHILEHSRSMLSLPAFYTYLPLVSHGTVARLPAAPAFSSVRSPASPSGDQACPHTCKNSSRKSVVLSLCFCRNSIPSPMSVSPKKIRQVGERKSRYQYRPLQTRDGRRRVGSFRGEGWFVQSVRRTHLPSNLELPSK